MIIVQVIVSSVWILTVTLFLTFFFELFTKMIYQGVPEGAKVVKSLLKHSGLKAVEYTTEKWILVQCDDGILLLTKVFRNLVSSVRESGWK